MLTFAVAGMALGQGVAGQAETERRLEELREQIELDRARLSQTAEAEQTARETLKNLEREIALREELVNNYRRRMQQLTLESDSLFTSVGALEAEIDELKVEYRRRAVHGYKYGRLHDLALILSARSINEMLIRVRYLHQFGQQRRQRLQRIAAFAQDLQTRRARLLDTRERTEQMLARAQEEERNLSDLRQQRRREATRLRSESDEIQRELQQKLAAKQQLEALMRRLAADESTRQRTATAAASAAYVELSGSFLQNRGRLPWPVEGAVQEPYGDRVNPLYGTTTSNPGLFIATAASAEVRAVFDGEVILVDVMPEYGRLVTIAHGEYKTVYSNFSLLYVTQGTQVRAGQVIGRAGTDAEPRGRGLFFAVFKNGQPVDPTPWLRNR